MDVPCQGPSSHRVMVLHGAWSQVQGDGFAWGIEPGPFACGMLWQVGTEQRLLALVPAGGNLPFPSSPSLPLAGHV